MKTLAALYAIVWLAKVFIVRRTLGAARFHGPDWCFDCRVPEGFYRREGALMLRGLRKRILAPILIEAAIGAVLWWQHKGLAAMIALMVLYIVSPFYYTALLRGRARWAWQFAVNDQPTVSSVVAPLRPRSVGAYQIPWLVWTLRAALATALLLVALALLQTGAESELIFVPGLVLYSELGLLLMKRALVDWRVSVTPNVHPERFVDWQDAGRRQFVFTCDYLRILIVTFFLSWAVVRAWPDSWTLQPDPRYVMLLPVGAVWLPATVALLRLNRRFVVLARNLKQDIAGWRPGPYRPPEGVFYMAGRLCFEPEEPKALVNGPRGLALNASSRRTRMYLAYLAGWPALVSAVIVWTK